MLMTYSFGHPCNLSLFHMLNSKHTVNIFKLRCNAIANINLEAQIVYVKWIPAQWEVPKKSQSSTADGCV